MASTTPKIEPGTVPAGFKAHTESSTTILVPESNTAFLNPVQQYNRDLSIAVIRAWNEMRKEEAAAKHESKMQKKGNGKGKGKGKGKTEDAGVEEAGEAAGNEQPEAGPSKPVSKPALKVECS
jgi:tRNA (guanine26-N2/guanine27-N2)-dimethyltransferase